MDSAIFQFNNAVNGEVDHANSVIRGVSIITGNLVAEGHELHVDDTTLNQVLFSANKAGRVPVKIDHGSGVASLCGYIDNFFREGNKVKGDWNLLKSHDETALMLERAERMPGCFGLSVAFKGKGVDIGGGKKAARCESLKAIDCVASPAANPDGLFSAKEVDKTKIINMNENTNNIINPDELTALRAELESVKAENAQLTEAMQSQNNETEISDEELAHLAQLGDEQLAEAGIDRSDVYAALADRGYSVDGEEGEGETSGEGAPAEAAMAGAGVGGGQGGDSAFSALANDVYELKAREIAKEQDAEEYQVNHAFAVLSAKTDALVSLSEKLQAENAALKNTVKMFQSKVASAGISDGKSIFFSNTGEELHTFQQLVQTAKASGKTEAEAIRFAIKENPEAHREFINSQAK